MSNCIANMTPTAGECWLQRPSDEYSSFDNTMCSYWTAGEADATSRITSTTSTDATIFNSDESDEYEDGITEQRQTNDSSSRQQQCARNSYKHVPHKERPPLIVARRNARERRRVQAVNSAFTRLRKVVPIINNRGKRVSKVKTLQTAIDYISGLQALLKQTDVYHDFEIISNYRYHCNDFLLEDIENEF